MADSNRPTQITFCRRLTSNSMFYFQFVPHEVVESDKESGIALPIVLSSDHAILTNGTRTHNLCFVIDNLDLSPHANIISIILLWNFVKPCYI